MFRPVSRSNERRPRVDVIAFAFVVPCMPPSFPKSTMLDEPGTNAIACWSVCTGSRLPPSTSSRSVRSKNDVPVRVANQTSNVSTKTRSALFGSTATALVVPVLRIVAAAAGAVAAVA